MIRAPVPEGDIQRIAALEATGLLGTPDDYALDCITNLAARVFSVPVAVISLVDADRQHFKSCVGMDSRGTRRDISFCGHVVAKQQAMVIEDAMRDIRFADNPLVITAPNVRSYAGHPIHAVDGAVLGTLCLIDFKPRKFTDDDRKSLKELAFLVDQCIRAAHVGQARRALVNKLTVARRESLIDPLLRTWNRSGTGAILDAQQASFILSGIPYSLLLVNLDHFQQVNEAYGHLAGDAVLQAATSAIRSSLRPADELGRIGGDELLAVLPETSLGEAALLALRLETAVAAMRVKTPTGEIKCTVSIGVAESTASDGETVAALMHRADLAMLARKWWTDQPT